MGNTSKGGQARLKNQASKIQVSGSPVEATGGGGEQQLIFEDIFIDLIKLNLAICRQGKIGDLVSVQLQSGEYGVYLGGHILGFVPINYNSSLHTSSEHQGKITQVRLNPSTNITIHVRVIV